jgi:hypothetical protein
MVRRSRWIASRLTNDDQSKVKAHQVVMDFDTSLAKFVGEYPQTVYVNKNTDSRYKYDLLIKVTVRRSFICGPGMSRTCDQTIMSRLVVWF